jgi:hypothetical protein
MTFIGPQNWEAGMPAEPEIPRLSAVEKLKSDSVILGRQEVGLAIRAGPGLATRPRPSGACQDHLLAGSVACRETLRLSR